jgi:hypothetical protein
MQSPTFSVEKVDGANLGDYLAIAASVMRKFGPLCRNRAPSPLDVTLVTRIKCTLSTPMRVCCFFHNCQSGD